MDGGFRFDDKNSRWGNPSYQLEPGDPGFVPDAAAIFTQTTKKKKHTMPKSSHIQAGDAAFSAQLTQFKTGIPAYATLFGLSAPQVAAQAADADYFGHVLACQQIVQDSAQQWTAWKDLVRNGGTAPAGGAPVASVFPPAVPAVAAGIEVRFRALVKLIKAGPNYNAGIGEALGIEGPVQAPPPAGSFQPKLRLEILGGQLFIHWTWEGHSAFLDSCEIHKDSGDGHGFALLVQDTTPNYTDPTAFPATPVKWKIKAIFRKGDARVGQWSDEVSIIVGG